MKTYMDLVPLYARAHRKQNRMTVFCIVLAVFLVTAIFGMADMYIRSQLIQSQREYGNWHVSLRGISDEQAESLAARRDVNCVGCYGILNYRGDDGYTLEGKPVAIMGCDECVLKRILEGAIAEGSFPAADDEAMVSLNVKKEQGVSIGDRVTVLFPDGSTHLLRVTGFINNTANLLSEDSYGLAMTTAGFRGLYPHPEGDDPSDYNSVFFVQFAGTIGIQKSIAQVAEQLSLTEGQLSENTKLMALLGQGSSSFTLQIYGTAAILFVLVLIAGVIMITSSLNSSVAGRTQFFGIMRCIGATKKQIKRIVRAEAFGWCLRGLPLGVGIGVVLIWVLCFVLRKLSPEYFIDMPAFGLSLPSILAGCVLGVLTVFFAAGAPAKRAARVSPLTAVSGNADGGVFCGRAAEAPGLPVEVLLGVQHARQSKKNYLLMSGSFALSIILFLSFAVTIDFMKHALTPMYPWTPDVTVSSLDDGALIPASLPDSIMEKPGVDKAYGRMAANSLPCVIGGEEALTHLISYEATQFAWAEEYLLEGDISAVQEQPATGLIVYDPDSSLDLGSIITVEIDGKKTDITVAGLLSSSPFRTDDGGLILICSEDTLRQVAGVSEYSVVDVQLSGSATDSQVDDIRSMVGGGYRFADERLSNSSARGAFYSFGVFIYGFLALIGLVTVFNIVNSIALSVAARTRQYGLLRAVGLSGGQLSGMIVSEAVTYTLTGALVGTAAGLGLNYLLFSGIVAFNWGDAWAFPAGELMVILGVIALSVALAVSRPIRQIKNTPIIDTICAQ